MRRHWHGQIVRYESPVKFWLYVAAVTAVLAALWLLVAVPLTDGIPLVRIMAFAALLMLASFAYEPSTLDMTGWTMTVWAMWYWGLYLFLGSPIIYALWHTFFGPHVEVSIK